MDGHLLILDVGSSALKAALFSRSGAIAAVASSPVATRSGQDRSAEQDVEDWWRAAQVAVAQLPDRSRIAAVALTGSMQNLIVLSRDGEPLGPAVLYSDRRLDGCEIDELSALLPPDYAERTGNRLDPAHCILKLMRIERFVPGASRASDRKLLFGAKDAVIFRMTGRAVIDPTTASTTGLFDIRARRWDPELIAVSGAAPDTLPELLAADAIAGPLLEGPAGALGLPPNIPVFNGAGDAAAASWGAFAEHPGAAYACIGTTGWVAATLPILEADPPRDIYTLADPVHEERAITVSPFLTAGSAVEWLSDVMGVPVEALLSEAEAEDDRPPGTMFLPYLCGERAPFEDQTVRGAFLGLDRGHRTGALCYAVLEGIAFAVRHNLEAAGLSPGPLMLTGGGARSSLQRRILADALGRELFWPEASQEVPALGIYRMIAPRLGFAQIERPEQNLPNKVAPRPDRMARADIRFKTYLDASQFARAYSASLATSAVENPAT